MLSSFGLSRALTVFTSDEFDLMTVAVTPFGGDFPSLPGMRFAMFSGRLWITAVSGTFTTQNAAVAYGTTAPDDYANFGFTTLNRNDMNSIVSFGAPGPHNAFALVVQTVLQIPEMTVRPSINVFVPFVGTGSPVARGRIVLAGRVFPA